MTTPKFMSEMDEATQRISKQPWHTLVCLTKGKTVGIRRNSAENGSGPGAGFGSRYSGLLSRMTGTASTQRTGEELNARDAVIREYETAAEKKVDDTIKLATI